MSSSFWLWIKLALNLFLMNSRIAIPNKSSIILIYYLIMSVMSITFSCDSGTSSISWQWYHPFFFGSWNSSSTSHLATPTQTHFRLYRVDQYVLLHLTSLAFMLGKNILVSVCWKQNLYISKIHDRDCLLIQTGPLLVPPTHRYRETIPEISLN